MLFLPFTTFSFRTSLSTTWPIISEYITSNYITHQYIKIFRNKWVHVRVKISLITNMSVLPWCIQNFSEVHKIIMVLRYAATINFGESSSVHQVKSETVSRVFVLCLSVGDQNILNLIAWSILNQRQNLRDQRLLPNSLNFPKLFNKITTMSVTTIHMRPQTVLTFCLMKNLPCRQ